MTKTGRKVRCVDCKYQQPQCGCYYDKKLEDFHFQTGELIKYNQEILEETGNCFKFKRKWYKFWVKP